MDFYYSKNDRIMMLELARKNIENNLIYKKNLELFIEDLPEKLFEERACFVTLNRDNMLRGCIGQMQATEELYKAIINMSFSAAFRDPRFYPLKKNELGLIEIEISILSPMKKTNYNDIKIGRHGVYIQKGYSSGVFLPQVADETGWTKDEFLENLCAHKAGLDKKAYLDKDTMLYSFEVELFSEKDHKR